MAAPDDRETRALAMLSSLPMAGQLLFHLWEQWSIFAGRFAYVDRLASTTTGLGTLLELVLFVLPLAAWMVLLARALVRRGRLPGQAREGDPAVARALGGVIPVVSPIAALALALHVVLLWGGRLSHGERPVWTYDLLRTVLGQPLWLGVHAVLVFAVPWHLAATLPDGLEAAGLVGPESRRSSYLVSSVLGACLFVLFAQLAGWLATGLGTFWPIRIVSDAGLSQ